MLLAKKIRINVSRQDADTLEFMQAKCRALYNWHLNQLKAGAKWSLYGSNRSGSPGSGGQLCGQELRTAVSNTSHA